MDFNYVRQRDAETKETRQARKYIALKFMKAVKTTTYIYVFIYICVHEKEMKNVGILKMNSLKVKIRKRKITLQTRQANPLIFNAAIGTALVLLTVLVSVVVVGPTVDPLTLC